MAHPLAADLLQRDFDAAFLADDAAILHPLVFAAQAFVVLDRTEDARAEQAVALGLERAVVDRFGLLDLAEGPRQDPLWRSQRDLDLVKCLDRCNGVERVVCQFLVHSFLIVSEGAGEAPARQARRRWVTSAVAVTPRPPPHPGVPCEGPVPEPP